MLAKIALSAATFAIDRPYSYRVPAQLENLLEPGMRVLDSCAAPGGKSFAAAMAMGGQGRLISCDIHRHKLTLIQQGAARLGLSCIATRLQDAREPVPEWEDAMDRVLVDAPCSGEGMFRKEPVARQQHCEALVKQCAELGAEILDCAAAVLALSLIHI